MGRNFMNGLFFLFILSVLCISQEYNPSEAKLKVYKITDKIYKLQCISGTYVNTLASVGKDGILLVDTGYPQTGDKLEQELKKLGDGKVRIVINSHEHNDHISGNVKFADEAAIISHEWVRRAFGGEYFALKAINRPGIPQVTFKDELKIYFNDEEILLKHYPKGHTLGDIIIHFTKSKIAFVGDMVFADCFPAADIPRNGDLNICLDNVQKIIDDYPSGTTFVNGHGPDYSKDDLKRYLEVGRLTKKLIEDQIKEGKTVEEILKSGLLNKWKKWGEGVVSDEDWITCVYQQYSKDNGMFKPSICKSLTEAIVQGNIQNVPQLYRQLQQTQQESYDFHVDELNSLGYRLINRGKVKEAIVIFKLNVEAYPESGNVYDSLAEAFMNDGQNNQAITYYKKSLEKNPKNENAKGMLKRLGYYKK